MVLSDDLASLIYKQKEKTKIKPVAAILRYVGNFGKARHMHAGA